MLPRFYLPTLDTAASSAVLPAEEGNHLARVMRLGVGDDIAVFDGRGHEMRARVASASRGKVTVELIESLTAAPEARVPITLVQAVLKGDKMDDVVRDATMMGVAAIEPIVTARTIVRSPRAENDRWVRVSIHATLGRITSPQMSISSPEVRSIGSQLAASPR